MVFLVFVTFYITVVQEYMNTTTVMKILEYMT